VGINTTGMATVFGTSDQAVPVTATMGTITANISSQASAAKSVTITNLAIPVRTTCAHPFMDAAPFGADPNE
jgi:hypothetical protein